MMDGIIVIDKPQGMTSHDVVSFLRRITGVKRIGHTGTLDPMATGVLPVFIGKATRLIEYAGQPGDPCAKAYRCTMTLGLETDTNDIWGKPVGGIKRFVPSSEIESVLKGFEGPGLQKPPLYSAVKVGGRKLYDYARKSIDIDEGLIKERQIYINNIIVNHIDEAAGVVDFDVYCARGVYIRSLCADAGAALGCGAVMSGLTRLKSDGFVLEDAIPLDELNDIGALEPLLLPVDAPLCWMPRAGLPEKAAQSFADGRAVAHETISLQKKKFRVYGPHGFIGIGQIKNGLLSPEKVLSR